MSRKSETTNENFPTCLVEWAGLLSTKNFSDKHPDEAYEFLLKFENYLRDRIWSDIQYATRGVI